MLAPKYLILKLKDQHKCMSSVNPFYIKHSLDIIARNVRNATKSKNCALLFEIVNEKQAENLLMANLVDSYLLRVERHTSQNSYPAVVATDFLDDTSDEI
jgi:hypothetical protein